MALAALRKSRRDPQPAGDWVDGLISAAPYMVCLCTGGRITFINPAGVRMLGVEDAAAAAGRPFTDFVDRDYAEVLGEELVRESMSELDLPIRIITDKASVIDVATTIRPYRNGTDEASCMVLGVDISERLKVTRDLRQARDELARLVVERTRELETEAGNRQRVEEDLRFAAKVIGSLSEAVVILDEQKKVKFVNGAFRALTGYAAADVIGKAPPFAGAVQAGPDGLAGVWPLVDAQGHWQGEHWNRRKDGTEYAEQVSISAISDDDGVVRQYAAVISDVTQRKQDEERIRYQANYDSLTGLPNRSLFLDRLGQAMANTQRTDRKLGLMFIDLDGFKLVNDTLGHDLGDYLLKEAAVRLADCVRSGDTVARLGGDEFTVIMPNLESAHPMEGAAERVLNALSKPFDLKGHESFISASIGLTVFPDDADGINELVKNADSAMYLAKEMGKASYQFFTKELNRDMAERHGLKNGLAKALENEQFHLAYQPKLDIASGTIIGVEALMRWTHPELGNVGPDRFIPILEETGQVVEVGAWALRTALSQHRHWIEQGLPALPIAVNLSARQLREADFVSMLEGLFRAEDMPTGSLEVEITESMLMKDTERAVAALERLHDLGIQVSMDDFGTGYSSLSYLKRFSIDTIKIDRSFVSDIADNPDDAEIIRTIISMGQTLNRKIVAEGVETAEQLGILRDYHCDQIQGYYLSRPLPGERFAEFYREYD